MPNPARDRGLRAERELAHQLHELTGWPVKRLKSPGAQHDLGDLWGLPDCVVQAADWTDTVRAMRAKTAAAEEQRQRAGTTFCTAAVRLRGGLWIACQLLPNFVTLLREATQPYPINTDQKGNAMREVTEVPEAEHVARVRPRDEWLDSLLTGKLIELEPADWQDRYSNEKVATSSIRQAAKSRGFLVSIKQRGDSLYVQALRGNGDGSEPPTAA